MINRCTNAHFSSTPLLLYSVCYRAFLIQIKMKTVKDLTVKVTYRVGLGDVEMPQKVYDQILEAAENGDDIDPSYPRKYADAADWLSDNIRERDCMDWEAEIEEVS